MQRPSWQYWVSTNIEFLNSDLLRLFSYAFVIVAQLLSHAWPFTMPWTARHQSSLSLTISQSLLKVMSIESVMPSNPSHPLSSPSPPTFNLSQHEGLFQGVSSLHQVTKVLELQLQHKSLQWIQCWFPLGLTALLSLLSKGLSRVFSSTIVQKN